MTKEIQQHNSAKSSFKFGKLLLGIVFDLIGMTTYLFPGIGEWFDSVWAPISGLLLVSMYKGNTGKIAGVIGTLEELIPFTDIIPTFTLTWIYTYVIKKEQ